MKLHWKLLYVALSERSLLNFREFGVFTSNTYICVWHCVLHLQGSAWAKLILISGCQVKTPFYIFLYEFIEYRKNCKTRDSDIWHQRKTKQLASNRQSTVSDPEEMCQNANTCPLQIVLTRLDISYMGLKKCTNQRWHQEMQGKDGLCGESGQTPLNVPPPYRTGHRVSSTKENVTLHYIYIWSDLHLLPTL